MIEADGIGRRRRSIFTIRIHGGIAVAVIATTLLWAVLLLLII
jgi:hypothetical protein